MSPQVMSLKSKLKLAGFLCFHLLLAGVVISWGALRFQNWEQQKQLPELRLNPLSVTPQYNRPEIVSDEDLVKVLNRLRPQFRGKSPRINHVDHALRFWGIEAEFDDSRSLSGIEMRDILLDHRRFGDVWGKKTDPLLVHNQYGVRPRVQEGLATSSHEDHTLATLAEVGTPADYPVVTSEGETKLSAMIEETMRSFTLNQVEYEWSSVVFALYFNTARDWMTTEGQYINFDLISERIMRQPPVKGVCYGNHRLHALVILLRVDEQTSILTKAGREKIVKYLQGITSLLVKNQSEEGFWDKNWDGRPLDLASEKKFTPVARRVLATGHAMEWWSLAPPEVLPPDETLQKAGHWLVETIQQMPESEIQGSYTFLSHAGRALALWRGKFPFQVDLSSQDTESL
ncbi:hypothetical protein [Gimesia maris]|uniref:Uncharacterized protein n=1 Tax=Gimesia maris TaxID=122 RepID=A0ABX5YL47_9PLAN|nr:hypothetical protein [Gimesia maris]EDL57000.1 hypothetical protein PM8797T_00604 [Gimesia maris DSM 8797]QEG16419.1 hypothetical protein GmarT_22830 [Gimesia maris]QGQ30388.1 hypothetical protein F1729_17990 [Gimesia maris]